MICFHHPSLLSGGQEIAERVEVVFTIGKHTRKEI
jgi:hypothetical protein